MKNILVPTDLSKCANDAVSFALTLAKFHQAKLYIFSALNLPDNWETMSEEARKNDSRSQTRISYTQLELAPWTIRAKEENIPFEVIIDGGNFYDALEKQVSSRPIDLVVMGSHGASGKDEYFIGSNAQKVVRKLHLPLFVIKDKVDRFPFKNIVFASSFNLEDQKVFIDFLNFVQVFSPHKIHLLCINGGGWFSEPALLMESVMDDFKLVAEDYGFTCETHFYRDYSVDAGIRNFSDEIAADLIVVSNHHRHPIKRIFSGSNVEALINHSDLPVLSLDAPETT